MQQAEHPTDHQTVPLYLCIVKDFKFHVKSHVLKGGGGRSDRIYQSQKSETVLADACGWLPSFSKPLDKQNPTENYLTGYTNSHFLTLYSAYL